MIDNTSQSISDILNHMISNTWLLVLIGLAYIIILEHKVLIFFFKSKQKKAKTLAPLWQRGKYLLLGTLLLLTSWTIVQIAGDLIVPRNGLITNTDYGNAGLIATIGLHLSAWSLILSAGGRWMVNLSKLFATMAVLYLVWAGFMTFT